MEIIGGATWAVEIVPETEVEAKNRPTDKIWVIARAKEGAEAQDENGVTEHIEEATVAKWVEIFEDEEIDTDRSGHHIVSNLTMTRGQSITTVGCLVVGL